ncbi:MAG: type IV pilus modification PilV family protein [Patescibacteria group bacterium]
MQYKHQNKKNLNSQRGFGLIEVIVGIAMLLITATAALSIAHFTTKAERYNEKRIVAYNLAQQVVEEVRRQRDSAWDDFKSDTRWESTTGEIVVDNLNNFYLNGSTGDGCVSGGTGMIDCTIGGSDFDIEVQTEALGDVISKLHGHDIDGTDDMADSVARRVYVDVTWTDAGTDRNLTIVTLLTDWKPMI